MADIKIDAALISDDVITDEYKLVYTRDLALIMPNVDVDDHDLRPINYVYNKPIAELYLYNKDLKIYKDKLLIYLHSELRGWLNINLKIVKEKSSNPPKDLKISFADENFIKYCYDTLYYNLADSNDEENWHVLSYSAYILLTNRNTFNYKLKAAIGILMAASNRPWPYDNGFEFQLHYTDGQLIGGHYFTKDVIENFPNYFIENEEYFLKGIGNSYYNNIWSILKDMKTFWQVDCVKKSIAANRKYDNFSWGDIFKSKRAYDFLYDIYKNDEAMLFTLEFLYGEDFNKYNLVKKICKMPRKLETFYNLVPELFNKEKLIEYGIIKEDE